MEDTEHYDDKQQWRYWILKPRQTICFPSGTTHGVFRISQWLEVISKSAKFPDCTNEDMTDT
jgi:hypothetical protein